MVKWFEFETKEIKIRELALTANMRRDIYWIRENGVCMMNIIARVSTIPDAGKGAFAEVFVREGQMIVPAPLLHIVDDAKLNTYRNGTPIGKQLLLNYCFGHVHSKLLLCPQSSVAFINHCSSRSSIHCAGEPNAKLQWATNWDKSTKEWLDYSLDQLMEYHKGNEDYHWKLLLLETLNLERKYF